METPQPDEGPRLRRPPAGAGAEAGREAGGAPTGAAAAPSAAAEEPRWRRALRVVVRKHLLVAWKRRRFVPVFVLAVVSTCLAAIWMKALKTTGDEGEDWRGFLAGLFGSVLFTLPMMNGVAVPLAIDIVSEKESKMKIIQSIYGLPLWLYWLSWVIYAAVMSLSSTFLVVAMGYLLGSFASSDLWLLTAVFLLGYANIIAFACCVAARHGKVRTASIIGSIVAIAGQFLGTIANGCIMNLFWWPEFIVNMFVPGAGLQSAMFSVIWLEYKGIGFTSEQLNLQIQAACEVNLPFFVMAEMLKILAYGVLLYAVLAWWLDNITQGDFGTAKPYTFFLKRQYVCPRRQARLDTSATRSFSSSLEISGLVKRFGDHVVLDHLDLSVKTGEIFALLGHNGAGKTTVFNCITGLHAPTEGSIHICGHSVEHETEEARRQLAVCPQDNPLYPEFTVENHLQFFGNLMGRDDLAGEIAEVLGAVGLTEQRRQLGEQLSGGQKRRLWVATALLGAQAVSLLDEPSSGMDPVSRRDLWALILQMKAAGRSIVFTTHYLDEADNIASRKAVMAHGQIRALGTSHELKAQFGVGYHLCVEETKDASEETRRALATLLHSHVADASVEFGSGKAHCVFPFSALSQVGSLLLALEAKRSALGSGDYSIQMTSLDDVFMELGRQADAEAQPRQALPEGMTQGGTRAQALVEDLQTPFERAPVPLLDMVFMFCWMRLAAFRRNRKMFWWYVFLPVVLISLSIPEKAAATQHLPGVMLLGFVVASSGAVSTVVKDVNRKCKHVALSQGLSHTAYWLGTFMADYLLLLVPSLSLLLAMLQKEYAVLKLPGAVPVVLAECFAYPVGVLLVSYHASFHFNTPDSAVKFLPLVTISLNAFQANAMNVADRGVELAVVILVTAMAMLNPLYSLEGTFVILDLNQKILQKQGEDWLRGNRDTPPDTERMNVPIHYWPLLSGIFVTYPILAAGLLLRDVSVQTPTPAADADEAACSDEEVLNEANRRIPTDLAVVRGLKHSYGKLRAVRGISFGLRSGECFGLLGPNGAGKTTTLAALTGEIKPSAGTVHMLGHQVSAGRRVPAVCRELGLCTQVDPLWDEMTGREHLVFYALIKGVPDENLDKSAEAVLQRLAFSTADADKAVGTYSGGMRRKLSIGIAIVGRPRILLLDEPTTAVDAVGKRHLWSILQARGKDQSVVLLTHSMEEAEALCTRIAIQVRGIFRCLGTSLRLKLRYGSEYMIELVLDASKTFDDQAAAISDFMRTELSEQATLAEQHGDHVVYRVPLKRQSAEDGLTVGKVFMQLGKCKDKLGVVSYCVNQPTLDQVFLHLAREQQDVGQG